MIGEEPAPHRRPRPTERTRHALRWLATRERPEFHTSDLRAHFDATGHPTQRAYLPNLLARYAKAGVVTQTGHGRYRINRDHPELAEA